MTSANLGQLVVSIDMDSTGLNAGISNAQARLSSLGTSLKNAGSTLTAGLTAPLAVAGLGIIKLASDAQEMTSKFNTVFGESAAAADNWAKTYADTANRSSIQIKGMMADFGSVLTGLGAGRDEAAKFSAEVVKLAMDLGSFSNMAPEEAFDRISSAMRGESEAAESLGVAMTEATIANQMAAMGLQGSFQDLDEITKKQVLFNLIVSQSGDAIDDATKTSESFANQMEGLKAKLLDVGKALGDQLLPAATAIIGAIKTVVARFGTLTPAMQKVIVVVGLVAAAIGPLLLILGLLATSISGIMGLVAGAGGLAGVGAAIAGALSSPILIAVAAVVALGAAIYAVWQDSEGFRKTVTEAFDGIIDAAKRIKTAIDGMFQGESFEAIKVILEGIKNVLLMGLVPAWEVVKVVVGGAVAFIVGVISGMADMIAAIVETVTDLWTAFAESEEGAEIIKTLQEAFAILAAKVAEMKEFLDPIVDKVIEVAGAFGKMVGKGVLIGTLVAVLAPIVIILGSIVAAIYLAVKAFEFASGVFATVSGAAKSLWDAVSGAARGIYQSVADFISPLTAVISGVWANIKENTETVWNALERFLSSVFDAIVINAIDLLTPAVKVVSDIWDDISTATTTIWGEVTQTVDGAIALILDAFAQGPFGTLVTTLGTIWADIRDAITGPIGEAYEVLTGLIDDITEAFENFEIKIPAPELPHVEVKWDKVGVGKAKIDVPDFSVEWYGSGGVFTSPAIIGVGESGPEAVVPLDKLPGLGGIDSQELAGAMASAIAPLLGGGREVTISLDGTTLGRLLLPKIITEAERSGLAIV